MCITSNVLWLLLTNLSSMGSHTTLKFVYQLLWTSAFEIYIYFYQQQTHKRRFVLGRKQKLDRERCRRNKQKNKKDEKSSEMAVSNFENGISLTFKKSLKMRPTDRSWQISVFLSPPLPRPKPESSKLSLLLSLMLIFCLQNRLLLFT